MLSPVRESSPARALFWRLFRGGSLSVDFKFLQGRDDLFEIVKARESVDSHIGKAVFAAQFCELSRGELNGVHYVLFSAQG
jgi:hypothetical protein